MQQGCLTLSGGMWDPDTFPFTKRVSLCFDFKNNRLIASEEEFGFHVLSSCKEEKTKKFEHGNFFPRFSIVQSGTNHLVSIETERKKGINHDILAVRDLDDFQLIYKITPQEELHPRVLCSPVDGSIWMATGLEWEERDNVLFVMDPSGRVTGKKVVGDQTSCLCTCPPRFAPSTNYGSCVIVAPGSGGLYLLEPDFKQTDVPSVDFTVYNMAMDGKGVLWAQGYQELHALEPRMNFMSLGLFKFGNDRLGMTVDSDNKLIMFDEDISMFLSFEPIWEDGKKKQKSTQR